MYSLEHTGSRLTVHLLGVFPSAPVTTGYTFPNGSSNSAGTDHLPPEQWLSTCGSRPRGPPIRNVYIRILTVAKLQS